MKITHDTSLQAVISNCPFSQINVFLWNPYSNLLNMTHYLLSIGLFLCRHSLTEFK